MNDAVYDKPLPVPTRESKPYWDGLKAHRLILQRCADCKKIRHYPRPVCDACHSMNCEWFEASGKGTVHSWSVNHHAFHPGFKHDTPYVLVTVDLREGVRMIAPLEENDASLLALDLPLRITYHDVNETITLPGCCIDA
jgi:uncharacterized OB-fold protein